MSVEGLGNERLGLECRGQVGSLDGRDCLGVMRTSGWVESDQLSR